MSKKVLFISGTRADFGKLKPLIRVLNEQDEFEVTIFVTGMHCMAKYGSTVDEINKAGFKNIHLFMNQMAGEPMDLVLANTIAGLARYTKEFVPDLLIVHGDRVEALAGAIIGSLNNILVGHIEGGEVSGTVDEILRHAISKLSHLHFVANVEAAERLKQMGEIPDNINIIGSPDIDIMMSKDLPTLQDAKDRYEITFEDYSLLLFHPVTTEVEDLGSQAIQLVHALLESGDNYVVIYPNNDDGSNYIFRAYEMFFDNPRFKVFPSIRFEYFLTILKNTQYVIGNSSVGIREAPVYGVPSINLGSRQQNRFRHDSIINVNCEQNSILEAIMKVKELPPFEPCFYFGQGSSSQTFLSILKGDEMWNTPNQKTFLDVVPK